MYVKRDTNAVVAVPEAARSDVTGFWDGSFLIQSTHAVGVQCINKEPYNMDGFLLYPTDVQGTEYYVMTGMFPCFQVFLI